MKPDKKAEQMTADELAAYIDHAVLNPCLTKKQTVESILEGIAHNCWSVCVNPCYVPDALKLTQGTKTKVCSVCDFPFGEGTTTSRVALARELCEMGVSEVDVVSKYNLAVSDDYAAFGEDLKRIADECHAHNVVLKAILETDALTAGQLELAVDAAAKAGVDFVKSSTGFFPNGAYKGATVEVVKAMMEAAGGRCRVKGSGAVRTKQHFFELIDMGIDRVGVGGGSTAKLLDEQS